MSRHVVVAGASGFLGTHLCSALESRGDRVTRLTRREPTGAGEVRWDPDSGVLDAGLVEDADVVVNLAGAPLVGNVFSQKWARGVLESRVRTTGLLADTIAASGRRPTFLAQNGTSWYGDHGAEPVDESADSRGDALLTRVTRAWQAATEPASSAGARVCVLRTAPVLDRRSSPMKQMRLAWRLGLGARLGDGHQHFPCISLRDWIAATLFLADESAVSGPVNLSCPTTPTNAELTTAIADAVGRRARLFAPRQALALGAGQMAPELLGSVNVVPRVLLDAGFEFADADVRDVVASALRD